MNRFQKVITYLVAFSFLSLNLALADQDPDSYEKKPAAVKKQMEDTDPEREALRAEIRALKSRLSALESRLDDTEKKVSEGPAWPAERYKLPEYLHDLTISGMVSSSANYNANEPNDRLNRFHQFDSTANTFQVDTAELIFHKHPEEGIGFRTDLIFGEIADNIASGGTSSSDNVDLQQAYVNYRASVYDRPLDIWFGKYVTLAGAEVIEDPSNYNWNITHSFMFYYSIPFTHTGARATYAATDWLTAIVGVNNGWDVLTDNNHAKTLETGLSLTPYDWLSWFTSFYHGAEQASDQGNQRSLVSSVLTVKPMENLTAMVNVDYTFEENAITPGANAEWYGIAGYLRYMLTEKWGLSGRVEFFNDKDGVRTVGPGANGGPTTATPQELWEFTLTTDYQLYAGLVGRLEYRHDKSDRNLFQDKGTADDSQDLVTLQFLYAF